MQFATATRLLFIVASLLSFSSYKLLQKFRYLTSHVLLRSCKLRRALNVTYIFVIYKYSPALRRIARSANVPAQRRVTRSANVSDFAALHMINKGRSSMQFATAACLQLRSY